MISINENKISENEENKWILLVDNNVNKSIKMGKVCNSFLAINLHSNDTVVHLVSSLQISSTLPLNIHKLSQHAYNSLLPHFQVNQCNQFHWNAYTNIRVSISLFESYWINLVSLEWKNKPCKFACRYTINTSQTLLR